MTLFTFAEEDGVDDGTILLVAILLLGIFVPTALFFAYQLFKRRHAIPIRNRYPRLAFCLAICYCIKLIISGSILLLLWNDKSFADSVFYKPLLMADNIFLYLFLCLTIWRLWSMKFDLSWERAVLTDDAWRLVINEGDFYGDTSWYLNHDSTCCCNGYLCPVIALLIILVSINVPVQLYGYNDAFTVFLTRCIFTGCIVVMLFLYIITPKKIGGRAPNFEINKELQRVFILNCALLMVCIAGFIYDIYYSSRVSSFAEYNERNVNVLIEESLYFAGEWFLVLFQTFYVLVKTGEFLPFYVRRRKRGATDQLGALNGNTRELSEILNNDKLFPWFLNHLGSEFSINNMLALIEFIQFQRYCSNHYKSNGTDTLSLKSDRIRIPDDLPHSSIVYMNESIEERANTEEFFNYALGKYHELYRKYMNNSTSKLQLILSEKSQKYFDSVLGDEQKWLYENVEVNSLVSLIQHLDRAIGDIYHLVRESFVRFVQLNNNELFRQIPDLYMNSLSATN